MLFVTQDLNVQGIKQLPSPAEVKRRHPITDRASEVVARHRDAVKAILTGTDPRLLIVIGPCSIHDPVAALDYARRLAALKSEVDDQFLVLMRVYFEKPRTTIGWKGLINDPHLDDTCDVETGLQRARKLLLEVVELGLAPATEFLDPFVPQYTADLIAWAAIGARTTESQTHREMASGLSMPVGFKNGTDGSLQTAIDAMNSARHPHRFFGVDTNGSIAVISAKGNPWGHLVLRGGKDRTNYDPDSIADAVRLLSNAGLPPCVMVDCSHANSGKQPARQELVWGNLIQQRLSGKAQFMGVMLESFLEEGNQPFPQPVDQLRYGLSITDPCLSWATTERILRAGALALRQHRAHVPGAAATAS